MVWYGITSGNYLINIYSLTKLKKFLSNSFTNITPVTISLWIDLTVISIHYVHFVVYIQKRFFIYFGVVLTQPIFGQTSAHLLEIISCPALNFVLKMFYLFFSLTTCHSIRNIIWLIYYSWWQSLVYIKVSTAITNHCFSFWNQKLSNT